MEQRKKVWLTIRKKLIVSYLIVLLLPSLLISGITYSTASSRIEDELMHSAEQSVNTADAIITQNISNIVSVLDYFGDQLTAADINGELGAGGTAVKERLNEYLALHKDVLNLYVATNNGGILLGADEELPDGFDPRTRDWYMLAMKTQNAVVSPVYLSVDGNPVVSISKVLKDGQGVVAVDLDLSGISNMTNMKVGEEGYILILDSSKNRLVHPEGGIGEEAKDSYVTKMFETDGGTFDYTQGEDRYKMAYHRNELTGWRIGGTMSQNEVARETSAIRNTTLIVVIASVLGASAIIYFIVNSVIAPLSRLNRATAVLGGGDLTEKLDGFKRDEIGDLAANFQTMVDNLRHMIEGVREMTDNVSASAEELSAGSEQTTKAIEHVTIAIQDVAAGSEQQLHSVESGAGSVDTMARQADYLAGNMQLITRTMSGTADSAMQGTQLVESAEQKIRGIDVSVGELAEVIGLLNRRAEEIGSIAVLMARIAQQTNMLALNASIEAARAGEQGRGFAVVAGEVRKLAEGSGHSAEQIKELIAEIQVEMKQAVETMEAVKGKVADGIEAVDLSGQSFERISQSVVEAAEVIQSAAETMQGVAEEAGVVEQAIVRIRQLSEEAAGNTQTISAAAEEQLASVEEISSSSADLSRMAEQLQELVGKFKVYKDEP
ncbi:HAMP domain-containing methyl-accepting chemotaxis protein [Paenibacillus macerans]|uniref:HAMP domain-containing methyl-accepting chemotaxis protein n=1 Tax=Paenibacillus macerans TaxID=44252 RepID=UPI003D31D03F